EEALHDAFASAVEQWPREGIPANPRAWLVSAGRFKAIDVMRRRARFDASLATLADRINESNKPDELDDEGIEDDRLRLIFTCCHPALPAEARVAHDRAADRPCQGQDQRRQNPLPGSRAGRFARAARYLAAGNLSRLQRR